MSWTEEKVSRLSELWAEGYSASAIGKAIGVSKNAVIGKAHRMQLTARPSPIKRQPGGGSSRPAPRPAPMPKPLVAEAAPPPPAPPRPQARPAPRPAARKAGGGPACLWPIGDPSSPDFHFCDGAAVPGKPYCEAHCQVAYITKSRSSEAA